MQEIKQAEMQLVTSEKFHGVPCDFYKGNNDYWLTRNLIGTALEYTDPRVAISKIHEKHKDRLDKFSSVTKLVTLDGKNRESVIYNRRGIMEICRWSRQPKADEFMDWVYDVVESFVDGKLVHNTSNTPTKKLTARELLVHQNKVMERMQEQNFEFQNTILRSFSSLTKIVQTLLENKAENFQKEEKKALPEKSKYDDLEIGAFESWRDAIYQKIEKIKGLENGEYNSSQILNYVYIYMQNTYYINFIEEVKLYREYFDINSVITNLEVIYAVPHYRKLFEARLDKMIQDLIGKNLEEKEPTEHILNKALILLEKWRIKNKFKNSNSAYKIIYRNMNVNFEKYRVKNKLPHYATKKQIIESDKELIKLFYQLAEKLYAGELE